MTEIRLWVSLTFFVGCSEIIVLGLDKPYKYDQIPPFWRNSPICLKYMRNNQNNIIKSICCAICYRDLPFPCSGLSATISLINEPAANKCDKCVIFIILDDLSRLLAAGSVIIKIITDKPEHRNSRSW